MRAGDAEVDVRDELPAGLVVAPGVEQVRERLAGLDSPELEDRASTRVASTSLKVDFPLIVNQPPVSRFVHVSL